MVREVEDRISGLRDLQGTQDGEPEGLGVHGTTEAVHHSVSLAEREIDEEAAVASKGGHRVGSLKTGVGDRARGEIDLSPRVDCGSRGHVDSGRSAGSAMMHLEARGSIRSSSRWTQEVDLEETRIDVKEPTLLMGGGATRTVRRHTGRGDPTRRSRKESGPPPCR